MASNNINVSLKSKTLKDKDKDLVLKFSDPIISAGGVINITQNGKTIEKIKVGSEKTKGGIYSLDVMLHDYEYNFIALYNDEIFAQLAAHDGVSVDSRANKEWANDLRILWNTAIDGKFYLLSDTKYNYIADSVGNYHSTIPEYTPGSDQSGKVDLVLSPFGGIKKLTVDPSKLKEEGSYSIDLSEAGLVSASGDQDVLTFTERLEFDIAKKSNSGGKSEKSKCGIVLSAQNKQDFSNLNSNSKFKVKGLEIGLFAIAHNKNAINDLSGKDVDLIYHKGQGKLYLNDNLTKKGLGKDGGLLATFKKNEKLSHSNFDWILSYDLHLKKDYQYGNSRPHKKKGHTGTLDLLRKNLTHRSKKSLFNAIAESDQDDYAMHDFYFEEVAGRSFNPLGLPVYLAFMYASKPHSNEPCLYFGDRF